MIAMILPKFKEEWEDPHSHPVVHLRECSGCITCQHEDLSHQFLCSHPSLHPLAGIGHTLSAHGVILKCSPSGAGCSSWQWTSALWVHGPSPHHLKIHKQFP